LGRAAKFYLQYKFSSPKIKRISLGSITFSSELQFYFILFPSKPQR
jgi:hypothetical protein